MAIIIKIEEWGNPKKGIDGIEDWRNARKQCTWITICDIVIEFPLYDRRNKKGGAVGGGNGGVKHSHTKKTNSWWVWTLKGTY